MLAPGTDGVHTDWVDATNGGTAVVGDFNNPRPQLYPNTSIATPNGAKPVDIGDKHSWSHNSANNTFASISEVTIYLWFRIPLGGDTTIQTFYRNAAGTEFAIDTTTMPSNQRTQQIVIPMSVNPDTSSAWTTAQLAHQFGVELIAGTRPTLVSADMVVEGVVTGSSVTVDYLAVDVMSAAIGEAKQRLVVHTQESF